MTEFSETAKKSFRIFQIAFSILAPTEVFIILFVFSISYLTISSTQYDLSHFFFATYHRYLIDYSLDIELKSHFQVKGTIGRIEAH